MKFSNQLKSFTIFLDDYVSDKKTKRHSTIIAIAGPKGGVGKTVISTNLSIALSNMGKRVTAVDLDLGGSNLHTAFGIKEPPSTLDDFIRKRVKDISMVIMDVKIKNLGVICGGDIPGIANLPYQQKRKLINHLLHLNTDVLILDLGAGASFNEIDFLTIADKALLVTSPELTSLLNVYSFIKAAVFRWLEVYFKSERSQELLDLLSTAEDFNNTKLPTVHDFFMEAQKIDYETAAAAKKILLEFKPFIAVNRVESNNDSNVGKVVQGLMEKYISINTSTVINIDEDKGVKKSIAMMKPLMIHDDSSPFSMTIKEMAATLCGRKTSMMN